MYYPAIRVRILQSEVMGSFKLCKFVWQSWVDRFKGGWLHTFGTGFEEERISDRHKVIIVPNGHNKQDVFCCCLANSCIVVQLAPL